MKYLLITILIFNTAYLPAQNTVLWKVTNSKSEKVSFLLGTYHILGNTFVDAYPIIKEKLKNSDALITETELNKEKLAAVFNAAPPTNNLPKILSEEDINFIKDILNGRQVDIFRLTPGILYQTLAGNYPKFKCGNRTDTLVFDQYLQNIAKAEGKKLLYLENDSLQLDLLYRLTKDFTWKDFGRLFPALLEKYKKNGVDDKECSFMKQYLSFNLNYSLDKKCADFGVEVQKRNSNWMERLPSLLEHDNCFIAVGLGHLFNKCGIIGQLRELGYTVEPINMQD